MGTTKVSDEFRVIEKPSKIFVQRALIKHEGMLWWKKESVEWKPVDKDGDPVWNYMIQQPITFNSVKDAQNAIKRFKLGTIIHLDIALSK